MEVEQVERCGRRWVVADMSIMEHVCRLPIRHDGRHRCRCGVML